MRVGIVGVTGYAGAELLRIVWGHPQFEVTALAGNEAQTRLDSALPEWYGLPLGQREILPSDPCLADQADLWFLATPAHVSAELAPALLAAGGRVVDLSGAFRLQDPAAAAEYYPEVPAALVASQQPRAVYGLTEVVDRTALTRTHLVANPGCYPTASVLALAPLAQAGLLAPGSVVLDAKSGVTGAGKRPGASGLFAELSENMHPYKVGRHQHQPEIEQTLAQLGAAGPVTFVTQLLPVRRGILVTAYAEAAVASSAALHELYQAYYAASPFVRVLPAGRMPSLAAVTGTNFCDLGLHWDPRTGRVVVVAAIDNLVKGAAGQAVQNANVMLGLPEVWGLGPHQAERMTSDVSA